MTVLPSDLPKLYLNSLRREISLNQKGGSWGVLSAFTASPVTSKGCWTWRGKPHVQGQEATKQLRWDSEAGLLNLKSPKFWATEKTEEMNSGEFLRAGQAQSLKESSGNSGHMLKLCDGHGKRKLSCSSKRQRPISLVRTKTRMEGPRMA